MTFNIVRPLIGVGVGTLAFSCYTTWKNSDQPFANDKLKEKVQKIAAEIEGIAGSLQVRESTNNDSYGFNFEWTPHGVVLKKDANEFDIARELIHIKNHHRVKRDSLFVIEAVVANALFSKGYKKGGVASITAYMVCQAVLCRMQERKADMQGMKFTSASDLANSINHLYNANESKCLARNSAKGIYGTCLKLLISPRGTIRLDIFPPAEDRIAALERELGSRKEIRPLKIFVQKKPNSKQKEIPVTDFENRKLRSIVEESPKKYSLINISEITINTYAKKNQIKVISDPELPTFYDLSLKGPINSSAIEELFYQLGQAPNRTYVYCRLLESFDSFKEKVPEFLAQEYPNRVFKDVVYLKIPGRIDVAVIILE